MTGYAHRDSNNEWIVERCLGTPGSRDTAIVSGDMVQLRHVATGRHLTVLPDVAGVTDSIDNRVSVVIKNFPKLKIFVMVLSLKMLF